MGKTRFRRAPDGSTNGWTYYLDGRPRREYQGNGAYWETTYDDLNRRVTGIFYTAANSPLATNITVLDRRGNVMQRVDAAGNSFTNLFDGLDRIKIAAGPAIVSTPPTNAPPNPGGGSGSTTNQQVVTSFYDSAGLAFTNVNALGEKTITYFDASGRVTRSEVRDAANNLVRQSARAYSADHQSVTVTVGYGATAVVGICSTA